MADTSIEYIPIISVCFDQNEWSTFLSTSPLYLQQERLLAVIESSARVPGVELFVTDIETAQALNDCFNILLYFTFWQRCYTI